MPPKTLIFLFLFRRTIHLNCTVLCNMSTPSCSHWPWLNSFAHNHRNWLFKVVQQRLGLLTRDYTQIDGEFQLATTSQRLISIFLLHLNIAETRSAYFFSGSQCLRTTSRILILTTFTDNFKYKHMPNISPAKKQHQPHAAAAD